MNQTAAYKKAQRLKHSQPNSTVNDPSLNLPKSEHKKDKSEEGAFDKFTQIRVKSIEFQEKKATAIYFYDMTHHVESLKLESEVLEQKNRHESLVTYQMTISHEFRTPLASSLMLLESLMNEQITA